MGSEFLINEDMTDDEPKQDQTIKIPSENRSQYEKLSSTQEDFSSDDELGTASSFSSLPAVVLLMPTVLTKNFLFPFRSERIQKEITKASSRAQTQADGHN